MHFMSHMNANNMFLSNNDSNELFTYNIIKGLVTWNDKIFCFDVFTN
jgi:hypothetical protein